MMMCVNKHGIGMCCINKSFYQHTLYITTVEILMYVLRTFHTVLLPTLESFFLQIKLFKRFCLAFFWAPDTLIDKIY